ncbi:DMT family transporter [Paludibacterium paludis]|nr:DMT family transporter [Paludibacterium paludis]
MTTKKETLGPFLVMLSAMGFGSMALFARLDYADGVGTSSLLAMRFLLAAAVLGGWVAMSGRRLPRGRELAGFALLGVLFAALAWGYFSALHYASSGLVALLVYTYPVLVAILAALLGFDRFGRAEGLALAVCVLGLAMLLGQATLAGRPAGVLLALLSGSLYAVYILIGSRFATRTDPLASTFVVLLASALVHLALASLEGGVVLPHSARGWLALFALAGFSSVMAVAAFLVGMRRIGPTLTSIVSTLEPVVTVGLGIAFLGETLSAQSLAGSLLVLGAAVGLAVSRGRATAPIAE